MRIRFSIFNQIELSIWKQCFPGVKSQLALILALTAKLKSVFQWKIAFCSNFEEKTLAAKWKLNLQHFAVFYLCATPAAKSGFCSTAKSGLLQFSRSLFLTTAFYIDTNRKALAYIFSRSKNLNILRSKFDPSRPAYAQAEKKVENIGKEKSVQS